MVIPGRDPVILLWAWWVSLALSRSHLTCVIPRADSCTIICTVHQRHHYKFGNVLPVMAGDCGDEIPSKSKPQSAGVTSSVNPANLLVIHWTVIKPSIFLLGFRELHESSKKLAHFLPASLVEGIAVSFICKAILSLPPLLFRVAVPLRSLPGTASLISIFLPNYLPYGILLHTLSHSTPPFCPSSAAHSCTYTLALPSNSSLFLRWSAAILGCRSEHSVRKPLHLSDGTQLFLTALFLWRPPCPALFEAFRPLPEFLPPQLVAGMHSSPS